MDVGLVFESSSHLILAPAEGQDISLTLIHCHWSSKTSASNALSKREPYTGPSITSSCVAAIVLGVPKMWHLPDIDILH